MIYKNKKGNIVQIVMIWIFSCFAYFTWGYPIVSMIVKEVLIDTLEPNTLIYYFGLFIPIIPVLGLLMWGYFIGQNAGIIPSGEIQQ
jgi:hypothetical protein